MIKLTQLFSQQMMPKIKSGSADMSAMDFSAPTSEFQDVQPEGGSRHFQAERFEAELYSAYESQSNSIETEYTESIQYPSEHAEIVVSVDNNTRPAEPNQSEQKHVSDKKIEHGEDLSNASENKGEKVDNGAEGSKETEKNVSPEDAMEQKISDVELALKEIKETIGDVKEKIVNLLKKLGIEVDSKSLSKEQVVSLQHAIESFQNSEKTGELQLNELVHALEDLGIAFSVAPMHVIEFDINGKKEISYLGSVKKPDMKELASLLEKVTALTKKGAVLDNKRAELKSLRLDGFLPVQKEDQALAKTGILDKIKEVFHKEVPIQESAVSTKKGVEHKVADGTPKGGDVKNETPKGTQEQQSSQQQGFAQTGDERKSQNNKQQSDKGPVLTKGQQVAAQQQATKGAEVKTSESVNVQHSVKIDGEKITIEKTKETTQGRGTQNTHVVRQVVKNVTLMVDAGKTAMSMQLKPEHLGRVSLDLQMEDSKMKLSLKVETEGAKQIVEGSISQLKETLNSQGITIEDIDIEVRKEGEFANLKEQQEEQQKNFKGHKRLKENVTLDVETEQEGAETGRRLGYNTMEYVA